jgi:hypothetical protein
MTVIATGSQFSPMDEVTLAHEYVHALKDQNFDIGARLKGMKGDSEKESAFQALVEGDATLAMTVYAQKHLTREQLAGLSQQGGGTSQEKLKSAPLVLRESLMFPYQSGAVFASALAQAGGWPAVDRAFAKPPTTTEQVIHPQKYTSGEGAQSIELPKVAAALGSDWSVYDEDTLGELGVYVYLAAGLQSAKAQKAAEGWGATGCCSSGTERITP